MYSYSFDMPLKSFEINFASEHRYILNDQLFELFANGPGDRGSIPGCVIPKT